MERCGFYISLKELQIASYPACPSVSQRLPRHTLCRRWEAAEGRCCSGSSRMTWASEQNWELEGCRRRGGGVGRGGPRPPCPSMLTAQMEPTQCLPGFYYPAPCHTSVPQEASILTGSRRAHQCSAVPITFQGMASDVPRPSLQSPRQVSSPQLASSCHCHGNVAFLPSPPSLEGGLWCSGSCVWRSPTRLR